MILGNVNRCCISTTKRIYYCECSILLRATLCGRERCSSSSSRPSILAQYLASTSLEQCLISGTLEQQWLNSGHKSVTVSICRNSAIFNHYHQWIYMYMCPYNSSMSIANIQYFHNQRRWRIAVNNKHNSAAQMFQMSIKVECCNKDVEQFFSSFSRSRKVVNFNFSSPF